MCERDISFRDTVVDMITRFSHEWQFPAYAYIPGFNEPHHFRFKGLVALEGFEPSLSACLGLALDLYRNKFFWETHVCLEALWIDCERVGEAADLLKSLIHVTAAFLKMKMGQPTVARRHLVRAKKLASLISVPLADRTSMHIGFHLNFEGFNKAMVISLDSNLRISVDLDVLFENKKGRELK